MGEAFLYSYDISLHAVKRYVERVKGEKVGRLSQEKIDAVRCEMLWDLTRSRKLPPEAGLAFAFSGIYEPSVSLLVSDTRVYLMKGRKIVTMTVSEWKTITLAEELCEQSATASGVFLSPANERFLPETLTCPSQKDAVHGLKTLSIASACVTILATEWECAPEHGEFSSRLARLRRKSELVNSAVFETDTEIVAEPAWLCYRYEFLRFAIQEAKMVVCVVV